MTGAMVAPAILVLSRRALAVAETVAAVFPDADLHGPADRVPEATVAFTAFAGHLGALFRAGRPIIGICASGILIRALGPLLADKWTEPPVLAVAEDGSTVVPLLGGHRGANRMAIALADALGCPAAVTTASDLAFGVALDDPPPGWRLADPPAAKAITAALLDGAAARVEGRPADWLQRSGLPVEDDAEIVLRVTERVDSGGPTTLVYHPGVLALGVGCERGADPAALAALVDETLSEAGLAPAAVALVASIDLKRGEPAILALADRWGVPARFFDADRLEQEAPRLTDPSEVVFRAVGCHGVAEAAALAAACPDATLVVAKRKGPGVTCAIARAAQVIDPARVGRGRGTLVVLGTGPGDPAWRPAETADWLGRVTDLVGYRRYLDLLEPLAPRVVRHDFEMGDEIGRARHALDLAAAGATVALVSSGDPGVYAMAAVVFELLDSAARPDWQASEIVVCPGITAMQAAAARVGAPLGHDFCAISLSDLLTPWPVIERRLAAAAAGDFVVALYNPKSQNRVSQLARAREILLAHRPAATPVVVARNLGREGERLQITTLDALTQAEVDMLTIVLIGSGETRTIARPGRTPWVYTPRGYGAKTG